MLVHGLVDAGQRRKRLQGVLCWRERYERGRMVRRTEAGAADRVFWEVIMGSSWLAPGQERGGEEVEDDGQEHAGEVYHLDGDA